MGNGICVVVEQFWVLGFDKKLESRGISLFPSISHPEVRKKQTTASKYTLLEGWRKDWALSVSDG